MPDLPIKVNNGTVTFLLLNNGIRNQNSFPMKFVYAFGASLPQNSTNVFGLGSSRERSIFPGVENPSTSLRMVRRVVSNVEPFSLG